MSNLGKESWTNADMGGGDITFYHFLLKHDLCVKTGRPFAIPLRTMTASKHENRIMSLLIV